MRLLQARWSRRDFTPDPESDIVISLTSFPARIRLATAVIECVLRQESRPRTVVLVLSREQFAGTRLPRALRNQVLRGLTLLWDEGDARAYKKLLPALRNFPEARIITLDDDKLYPTDWIGDLVAASDHDRRLIIGHQGREMTADPDGRVRYGWRPASCSTPSERLFLIGCGGVLYPPGSLGPPILDLDAARSMTPDNDDHWFFGCSVVAGTRRWTTGRGKPPGIRESHASPSLSGMNGSDGRNDVQFQAVLDGLGIRSIVESGVRGSP